MVNGPFNGQLFSDHQNNIVGMFTNRVYLLDNATGQISRYMYNNGWLISTFASTTLSGGSSDGETLATLHAAGRLVGIGGASKIIVEGTDGSLDAYELENGMINADRTQTTFSDGPLAGQTFASANIIGCRTSTILLVLLADGTVAEYSIVGRFRVNYTASTLTGGYFDGDTFSGLMGNIVGAHKTKVFIFNGCQDPSGGMQLTAPNANHQVEQSKRTTNVFNVEAFPNPLGNQDFLNIKIQTAETQVVQLQLFDATGKLWKVQKVEAISESILQLVMSELPDGIYFLSVKTDTDVQVIKLLK